MTREEIIQHWLKYSEYDPDQKSFNLLSANYRMNRICEGMKKILAFDPSGTLAILYAKRGFLQMCEDVRITMLDVLGSPESFAEDKEMWDIFNSPDIAVFEEEFLNRLDALVTQTVPTKQLGERNRDAERLSLSRSIEFVVEEMTGLREDLFLRGGVLGPITHFSTHIHAFDSLAQCLLALESAQDGMYLCYVASNGTADGNFGFYIKSNGSLLSVNERVNEAYPGQHKCTRNGRWQDAKKVNLFPYHYIFDYMDHDYKGYPGKQVISDEKLGFFALGADVYIPLLISMILLGEKYAGTDPSGMELKYVDSLLPKNIALPTPGTQALVVSNKSALAAVNAGYEPTVTTDDIITNRYGKKYKLAPENRRNSETIGTAHHPNDVELFTQLYGEGFVLNTDKLLLADPLLKALPAEELAKTDLTPNCEFVGTRERLDLIAYQQGRAQLAAYIRSRMLEEYEQFGGVSGVNAWLQESIRKNAERLYSLCAQKYIEKKDVNGQGAGENREKRLDIIYFEESSLIQGYCQEAYPLNKPKMQVNCYGGATKSGKWLCPITYSVASMYFQFYPNNWRDLEFLFGEGNVPKAVIGWRNDGHFCYGNPLLNVTDPVTEIGTLLEDREIRWRVDFSFRIGFSKRGLAKLVAEVEGKSGESR